MTRNTVRRYLRDEAAARYKPRPPRSTKLDPFKAYVGERLGSAAPEWIPASVLLMELRERGYCGGYTMLKLFVASLRPQQVVEPVIRFETGPGEQMQVDWAALAPCMMRGPGCAAVACVKFSNLVMVVWGGVGGEPPVSVAAVAARRVDHLQLLKVEFGNR